MQPILGTYHFRHYTIDRYTGQPDGNPPFIDTRVTFREENGRLAGTITSKFGSGAIEQVTRWDGDACSFGGDMGGSQRVWWSLRREGGTLKGTVMPWEPYDAVRWPLHAQGRRVAGTSGGAAGVYAMEYRSSALETGEAEGPAVSRAYLELKEENGVMGGTLRFAVGIGKVSEFEQKGDRLYFRLDYAENQNTWVRLQMDGDTLCGDVTPYPFHFAWPFLVEGEKEA